MRKVFVLTLSSLFFLPLAVFSEQAVFVRNLGLGDSGSDVLLLQRVLNADLDTRVAEKGAGSPGLETPVFGQFTRIAVMKFQRKYASGILFSGQAPTGFVGPKTLRKLNTLAQKPVTQNAPAPDTRGFSVTVESRIPPSPGGYGGAGTNQESREGAEGNMQIRSVKAPLSPEGTNPNLVNLDTFIETVNKVGEKKGYTRETLGQIDDAVRKVAATTTDFRAKFRDALARDKAAPRSGVPQTFSFGGFVRTVLAAFDPRPRVAEAQVGMQFVGAVFYLFFCPCSGNWLVGVQPLPPSFATLLSYYEGSQMFAGFNAPFTPELLGFYEPGVGVCLIPITVGCIGMPTEGLITGFLGSAVI